MYIQKFILIGQRGSFQNRGVKLKGNGAEFSGGGISFKKCKFNPKLNPHWYKIVSEADNINVFKSGGGRGGIQGRGGPNLTIIESIINRQLIIEIHNR